MADEEAEQAAALSVLREALEGRVEAARAESETVKEELQQVGLALLYCTDMFSRR